MLQKNYEIKYQITYECNFWMVILLNTRLKKFTDKIFSSGFDTVILTDPCNMYYYSGFYNGEGCLLIKKDGFYVVTDSRYTEYATKVCDEFEVIDSAEKKVWELIDDNEICGFEDLSISYKLYQRLTEKIKNLRPIGDAARIFRAEKDDYEIECIKKAAEIADNAFEHICSYIRVGMSEAEIAAEIDCFMKKNGAFANSFPTIVASGARGSLPHAIVSDKRIKSGELLVMDFGCICDGYCSDMTRTVAVGKISDEFKEIYDTVLESQLKSLLYLSAGKIGRDVDFQARTFLNGKYPGCFSHALGHSVGLEIHENPNLSPKNDKPINSGCVITVEPGLYIPGKCGVRIEDLVVVCENGCKTLSHSPKNLITVG